VSTSSASAIRASSSRLVACLRPAPPPAAIRCRPHRYPAWGPQHRRRLDPSTQRRSAVGVGHAACLRFRLLGFEAGQEVRMPGNWSSVEMRASSATRPGRPEPGLAGWRPGEVAQGSPTLEWRGGVWLGAQRTRGGRRRRLTSRQTAAHSRWGSGRWRAKTMVPTPRSSWPWRSGWEPGSVKARQA
jgi:hypothetical protein